MQDSIEEMVADYDAGRLDRRQLIGRLGAVVAAALVTRTATPAEPGSTFRSLGLNHIALRVTDVARSRDFYMRHFGHRVLSESDRNCFLAVGENNFLALFRAEQAGMDHYCYTIRDYDPGRAVETLKSVGLQPVRRQNRVYFDDPDGLEVQVASEWGDYPGDRR